MCSWARHFMPHGLHNEIVLEFDLACPLWWLKSWYPRVASPEFRRGHFMSTRDELGQMGGLTVSSPAGCHPDRAPHMQSLKIP